MTRGEAIEHLRNLSQANFYPRTIMALDMAIEALQNLSKPNNGLQGSDLISTQMAIEHWGRSSGNLTNDQIAELQREIESLPSAEAEDRLYIKIYADDEPSVMAEKLYQICDETQNGEVAEWLKEYFPSADRPTTDCTEFMEWLKAEVLDENNWELNAVAYGEIICRKLKKLGWIDVEDGCYVDTRPTGEWVEQESDNIEKIYLCSNCENYEAWGETEKTPYCPNCGAKMFKGGEEE